MAYVQPREAPRDLLASVSRHGARFVAVATYCTALAVAVVLLAPVLFDGGSGAGAEIPSGPEPITYAVQRGEPLAAVAAGHGLSLARLYALNPGLAPLGAADGKRVVVGLR